jgi:hypothetical protein
MNTGNGKTPSASASAQSSPLDWRRVVSTACLKCDWGALAKAALGSTELSAMVGEAFRLIGQSIERDIARADAEAATRAPIPPPMAAEPIESSDADDFEPAESDASHVDETPAVVVDVAAANAAAILGVAVDASADEIRAALRARLSASRLHPDHGGDGEEAKRLIAAKNLLIERARAVRS